MCGKNRSAFRPPASCISKQKILCATVGLAAIESENIVGYASQTIQGGKLNCVALQFGNIDNEDVASIVKLMTTGLTPGEYDTMETAAPCIQFYNGIGYDYFYYISDAFDEGGNPVTAWADFGGDVADTSRILGAGFWLTIPEGTCDDGTFTQAGQVNSAESITINLAAGLTLAGNPYPSAFDFSKITTDGLQPGEYDTMETEAPCIQFYNGIGYDYFYYISDAFDKDGNPVTAWANFGGDVAGEVAQVGKAFWATTPNACTLTFTK